MDAINLEYNKKQGLLNVISQGDITAEMIVRLYETMVEHTEYPRDLKVLIIAPVSEFKLKPSQMKNIVAAASLAYKAFNSMKEALVVEGTYNTMIATLFKERSSTHNFQSDVFSSKEAALKWLFE